MTELINFDSMLFCPETKNLSILSNNEIVVEPINLSNTAVKLQVVRDEEQLQLVLEQAAIGSLNSDSFELKIRFNEGGNNASLLFGDLQETLTPSISEILIGAPNQYNLFWVGASDLRINAVEEVPTGLLLMEGKITSFEINSNFLVLRYHDSIS